MTQAGDGTEVRSGLAAARSRGAGRLARPGRIGTRRRHAPLENGAFQPGLPHPRDGRPSVAGRSQDSNAHALIFAKPQVFEKPGVLAVLPMMRVLKPKEFVQGCNREVPRTPRLHADVAARRDLWARPRLPGGRHDGCGDGIAPARPNGEHGAGGKPPEPRAQQERGETPTDVMADSSVHERPPKADHPRAGQVSPRALGTASRPPLPPPPARDKLHRPVRAPGAGGRPM